ncbi:MAG: relaxase/mobilization nuclease domain-containing protein, partial [Ginsengibacter sp.]
MIFKIFTSGATFHAVDYNEKKHKNGTGDLVHFDNFGSMVLGRTDIGKKEFVEYLQKWSARNKKIKQPQFHAVLSCKGKEITHEQLKDSALEIMKDLGYSGIPILIYSHNDTDNNHVHIVTSRVGVNGKKVNHTFERKRANAILNRIQGLEPKQEFSQNVSTALKYHFTTIPQFSMLMERMGYTVATKEEQLQFYKHGQEMGELKKDVLLARIQEQHQPAPAPERKTQIVALVHKYAKLYDSSIQKEDNIAYTTKATCFRSDLSDFLKQSFGLEFVFFAAKGKDSAYGYSIIDNKANAVFKGSEIMKLDVLDHLSAQKLNQEGISYLKTDYEPSAEGFI